MPSTVERADRRSRLSASILALLTAVSIWLSLGTIALTSGDAVRIAALPSLSLLATLIVATVAAATAAKLRLEHTWPLVIGVLVWLPFLPGRIPNAFLVWQGPLEWFVWLAVAAGLIAARRLAIPNVLVDPNRAPWIAAALVALGSLTVFSQVRAVVPGGDEPHYLAATQSVLKDGDLRVANNYASGDYLEYFPGRLEPHYLVRSRSGEIYSIHAPGVSLVILPAFAVAGYAGAVVTIAVIAALTALLAWRLAFRLTSSASAAWVGVAAVLLTTPYFFHTFTIYPEVIGGLCVLCGVWLLIALADGRDPGAVRVAGVGALLALLPWLHTRFAVLAGILGLLILVRMARRSPSIARIAQFMAAPAIAGAAWFAFFYVIWGSPSPTVPYGPDSSTSVSYIMRGLIGLLVDQQFGIVFTAPIYVAACAGVVLLFRQQRRLTVELALIVVPYAIAVSSYAMWWAGSAAPARFLASVLPLAVLPIAVLWKERRSTFVLLLLMVSIALVVPRAFVEGGRFIFNGRGVIDPTLEWLSQTINLALALPSVHRDGGSVALWDATVRLAVFVTAAGVAAAVARRWKPAAWTAAAIGFAIALMASVGLVSVRHAGDLVTPQRSILAAIGALRSWHTLTIDLSRRRVMERAELLEAATMPLASRINRVPAGEYELVNTAGTESSIALRIGRNDAPFERFSIGAGSSQRVRLPVSLQTMNVEVAGDIGAWQLRPLGVTAPAAARRATHAASYGNVRAFFLDERAYPERDGFWMRADSTATVVIASADAAHLAGLPLSIIAGAVPTSIRVSADGLEEVVDLAAGEARVMTLPRPAGGAWRLRIRSGAGFRPSERDPGNRDVRALAAWIAIK